MCIRDRCAELSCPRSIGALHTVAGQCRRLPREPHASAVASWPQQVEHTAWARRFGPLGAPLACVCSQPALPWPLGSRRPMVASSSTL
eukprot:5645918-Alexandrium_andersonii.AAC.1